MKVRQLATRPICLASAKTLPGPCPPWCVSERGTATAIRAPVDVEGVQPVAPCDHSTMHEIVHEDSHVGRERAEQRVALGHHEDLEHQRHPLVLPHAARLELGYRGGAVALGLRHSLHELIVAADEPLVVIVDVLEVHAGGGVHHKVPVG
eukprot:scaffold38195_cov64-Phaeocystis_antarctica.AAC.6